MLEPKIFFTEISSANEDLLKTYETFLSNSEKERLRKTSSHKARISFILGRFLIKTKLAKILKCSAQEVVLKIAENGRPEIESPKSNLSFNLSHSNNLIVLVISDKRVGVDIEFLKKRDFLKIAEEFFTKEEFDLLKESAEQQKLFYKFWTRKEALIKCKGEGLFNHDSEASGYEIITQEVAPDYVMSIALVN